MINIAVTGGIGAGKTMVTEYLSELGFTVIDADQMSRDMTSAGGKAMPYILEHFGPDYINEDGSLNRAAMRDLVFRDPHYKQVLEEGTTKVVLEDIEKIREEKSRAGEKALFFDIPLLFELHQEDNYDLVWAVSADRELRKQRVMERDGTPPDMVDLIIGSQSEDEYKTEKADVVLNNNGSLDDLKAEVRRALKSVNAL